MLTDKCRYDFIKFLNEYLETQETGVDGYYEIQHFEKLPLSMRFGVYVDFFDSVGILIDTDVVWSHRNSKSNMFEYCIKENKELMVLDDGYNDTRQESRQQAIIKANKIYNERYSDKST